MNESMFINPPSPPIGGDKTWMELVFEHPFRWARVQKT